MKIENRIIISMYCFHLPTTTRSLQCKEHEPYSRLATQILEFKVIILIWTDDIIVNHSTVDHL